MTELEVLSQLLSVKIQHLKQEKKEEDKYSELEDQICHKMPEMCWYPWTCWPMYLQNMTEKSRDGDVEVCKVSRTSSEAYLFIHMQGEGYVVPNIKLRARRHLLHFHVLFIMSQDQLMPDKRAETEKKFDLSRIKPAEFCCVWSLPVCLTHGLRSPDEAAVFVCADRVLVISQQRTDWGQLPIGWTVNQHNIHHFLFVQDGLIHSHDGLGSRAKLETVRGFNEWLERRCEYTEHRLWMVINSVGFCSCGLLSINCCHLNTLYKFKWQSLKPTGEILQNLLLLFLQTYRAKTVHL